MTKRAISAVLRQCVVDFTDGCCGYCQTSQRLIGPMMEIDHIHPKAHGGKSDEENLILACPMCNSHKGSQLEAIDPVTMQLTPLFNPRLDRWYNHFEWGEQGAVIVGVTAKGRATVNALDMNHPQIVSVRRMWISVGWHPPRK